MKTRLALAALLFAAPAAPALAFDGGPGGFSPYAAETTGGFGLYDQPFYALCSVNSAAEGNANQQARPVKQYGQTAGGYGC